MGGGGRDMEKRRKGFLTEAFGEVPLHFLPGRRLDVVRGLKVLYLPQQGSSGGGDALCQVLAATLVFLQTLRMVGR